MLNEIINIESIASNSNPTLPGVILPLLLYGISYSCELICGLSR